MKRYVDGYVLPLPKKNISEYKKMASAAAKIWMKHGALGYYECVGEDLKPDTGGVKISYFPSTLKTKASETVVFAFILYRSKAHRDKVNAKVMADPAMAEGCKPEEMPFEVKNMIFGGFESLVALEK